MLESGRKRENAVIPPLVNIPGLNTYLGPPDQFLPINEHCSHEHNR
jgi:hypothetical protein